MINTNKKPLSLFSLFSKLYIEKPRLKSVVASIVCLGAFTALVSACGSTGNAVYSPTAKSVYEVGNRHDLSDIKVLDLRSSRQGGMFVAQATLQNTTSDTTMQLYYRCAYYDKNLFTIDDAGAQWMPVLIYANQELPVKCSTANLQAHSFKVELSASGSANNVQ